MKNLTTFLFAAAGLMILCPTEAQAGPRPGRYMGKLSRECPAAKPVLRAVQPIAATASNPTNPAATFSTRVRCSGSFGVNDKLNIALDVLPDGKVAADISGTIPRLKKPALQFRAKGSAPGSYTATSFRTRIPRVMVNGKPASLEVIAQSIGNKLKVDVRIDPVDSAHPLGSDYEAEFEGNRS